MGRTHYGLADLEGDEWSEATAETAGVAPAQVEGEGGEGATEYGDAGEGRGLEVCFEIWGFGIGFGICDLGSGISDLGSQTPAPRLQAQGQDPRSKIPDPRSQVSCLRSQVSDPRA